LTLDFIFVREDPRLFQLGLAYYKHIRGKSYLYIKPSSPDNYRD